MRKAVPALLFRAATHPRRLVQTSTKLGLTCPASQPHGLFEASSSVVMGSGTLVHLRYGRTGVVWVTAAADCCR